MSEPSGGRPDGESNGDTRLRKHRAKTGQRGASLRAYDKRTGAQIGEVRVPAPIVGHPMTYMLNGRQYIVVGVSGGNYTGEYISFALPQSEIRTTTTAGQQ